MNTTCLPGKADPERRKPDISVFSSIPNPDSATRRPQEFHWGAVELWIETKPKKCDPFIETGELQKHGDAVTCHIGWTKIQYKTCGQLIAYAAAIHRFQFRVFSFSIVLFDDTARLLRWDRSGIIYTEAFKWADGSLFEFLWRFNHLSAVDRGYDTTVCPVEDDEAEAALPKLRDHLKVGHLGKEHLRRILAWDDHALDNMARRYITPNAKWATDALIGRATFGYVAYDVERDDLVYLKDFWRADHPEIQTEGKVYCELHEAQVPNIAKLERAGDVRLTTDDGQAGASMSAQRTRTQDYLNHSWCPGRPEVEPYVHYRLVLETVGKLLNRFESTRQLCEVIRDAVVGK
jgi:Fungal protein kinase